MNYTGEDCSEEYKLNECEKTYVSIFSMANRKNDKD